MNLEQLTYNLKIIQQIGDSSTEVKNIVFDSRKVEKGDMFVALVGSVSDGHQYIELAIEKGATCIVCETLPQNKQEDITYIQVKNTALALGHLASCFYDNPSKKIKLIGVTGTNGKTTTSTLLYELGESLGYACALLSTIHIKVHQEIIPTEHTTPDIVKINKVLHQAVEAGCEYAFMEVSSHGIEQHRIAGLHFSGGAFTNITHDHLDYHKTFHNYLTVKKSFFDELPKEAFALTNTDDKNGVVMLQNTVAKKCAYALKTEADYKGKIIENQFHGMLLNFNGNEFWTRLVGKFNAYNLLLVYGITQELGWNSEEVLVAMSKLKNVNGRFELFKTPGGINVIVDYAHTPDALENVIDTLQEIRSRNEKMYVVAGCGGNRDTSKRSKMGAIMTEKPDFAIITSDNPRHEDPEAIIQEVEKGVEAQHYKKYISITDRKEAIKTAFKMAEKDDIILIAGKGHETYQDVKGVKHHFDDMEIAVQMAKTFNS